MIIVGDMGGTHVRMAYEDSRKGEIADPQKFKIAEHNSFYDLLSGYLTEARIKGTEVSEFRMAIGNRSPWDNIETIVNEVCPGAKYKQINDFAANSYGIAMVPDCKLRTIRAANQAIIPTYAARAVIGPGTGTGLAYINKTKFGEHVQCNHGAHMPPTYPSPEHQELFAAIHAVRKLSPQIIVEDILSGPGLWALYNYFHAKSGTKRTLPYRDTNDMIRNCADDMIAAESLRVFHEVFGAFAAQVIAFGYAYRGLYLTGGITDKLMEFGRFDIQSFLRFYDLKYVDIVSAHVAATPIYWVDDTFISLKGLLHIE